MTLLESTFLRLSATPALRARSMRIGLISYEYPPQEGIGGVGTYSFRLAGALGRAGHQVFVLAGPTADPELPSQPNVFVRRLDARYEPPLRSAGLRWLYWRGVSPLLAWNNQVVWHWLRWSLAAGQALLELQQNMALDVIEAPEHAANGFMAGRLGQCPLVTRVHGPWELFCGLNRTSGWALNRLLSTMERRCTVQADMITTPSYAMSRMIQRRWGLAEMPRVIPNFMDVPSIAPSLPDAEDEQRIVCAGRIERFKGQDAIVKAFAQIAPLYPKARLVLVGPDQWSRRRSFASLVEALVPSADIRSRIELTGPLSVGQVQQHLARAAIAVVFSRGFESFSCSTLEAMAAGRPIVASRSGAIPELLDNGRCGLLAEPGDVAQLAQHFSRLLADRALCQDLGAAAHQRARACYDTDAVLPQFIEAYAEARGADRGVEFATLPLVA